MLIAMIVKPKRMMIIIATNTERSPPAWNNVCASMSRSFCSGKNLSDLKAKTSTVSASITKGNE